MKVVVFVFIVFVLAGCSAVEMCRSCMSQPCPQNSFCKQFENNGQIMKGCVCNAGFISMCKNTTDGGKALTCFAVLSNSTSSCGGRQCNEDQLCAVPDTEHATCVCKNVNMVVNQDGDCVCRAGLAWDEQTESCVVTYPTSCDTVDCAEGFVCVLVPGPGSLDDIATCVPDISNHTVLTCGVNFRCPETQQCIQTERGPSCVCKDGWGGVSCEKQTCYQDGEENCPEHSTCLASADGQSTPVCVCDDGWFGPYCNRTSLLCQNTCAFANSECVDGECKCSEGYVPDFQSKACVPASTNNTNCFTECNSNSVCASITSDISRCVCLEAFGAIDCSKPSCETTDQCGNNQVCVRHTTHNVPPFCTCKFGYTGQNCDIPIEDCNCSGDNHTHTVCSNEGSCICAPGWYGDNCSEMKSVNCSSYVLTVDGNNSTVDVTDALEVKKVLLEMLGVDNGNLDVFDPLWRDRRNNIIMWTVRICGDVTLDEVAAGKDLLENYLSADSLGMGVTGVQEGETANIDGVAAVVPFFLLIAVATTLMI